jgi:crotonobetainyl-CoA:carnitine CoA-transferase CaiB-like acyl-CoA transferase
VPYGAYRCGDGEQVLFAVQSEAQWIAFCRAVALHPEWLDDPRFETVTGRRTHRGALEGMIEEAFSELTREAVTERLDRADVPYGDLNSIAQFAEHPQLAARDRWRDVPVPGGVMRAVAPPMGFSSFGPLMGAVPAVGEHSRPLLAELGFDSAAITCLLDEGAVMSSQ